MKFLITSLVLVFTLSQAKAIENLPYENVKSKGLQQIRSCLISDQDLLELYYTDFNQFRKISSHEINDIKAIFSFPNEADPNYGYDPLAGLTPFQLNTLGLYFEESSCDIKALVQEHGLILYSTSFMKMPYIDYLILIDQSTNEVFIPSTGND